MLALAFLAALQGATPPLTLPPEVARAVADWGMCRGRTTAGMAAGPQSPEAIADAVLAACLEHQRRLAVVGVPHYGQGWRRDVDAMAARYRTGLVTRVREIRSGAPPSDPNIAWGHCVGRAFRELGGDETPEAAADRIFAGCGQEERAARALAVQLYGPHDGEAVFGGQRATIRARVIELIRGTDGAR
jgi:hypothetical protein